VNRSIREVPSGTTICHRGRRALAPGVGVNTSNEPETYLLNGRKYVAVWGMTPYGLRKQNEATAASRATTTRQTAPWARYAVFGVIVLVLLVLLVHLASGRMHGHGSP
jgi:hypothetical protein